MVRRIVQVSGSFGSRIWWCICAKAQEVSRPSQVKFIQVLGVFRQVYGGSYYFYYSLNCHLVRLLLFFWSYELEKKSPASTSPGPPLVLFPVKSRPKSTMEHARIQPSRFPHPTEPLLCPCDEGVAMGVGGCHTADLAEIPLSAA